MPFLSFLFAIFLLLSSDAYALDVEFFRFTNSKSYALTDDALLENSFVDSSYPWILTGAYDYVKVPLSIRTDDSRSQEIISSLSAFHLGGGYRIKENILIGARTYLATIDEGTNKTHWGDSVVELKWRFFQDANSAIAFAPNVTIPTGTSQYTTNNRKFAEYVGFNYERTFGWFQLSGMLGFSNKPGATFDHGPNYTKLDYKQSLYTAIGTIFPLTETWALNVEGYRHNQLKGNQHPNEGYVGFRNQTTPSISTFFGTSVGGIIDKTSNDYRLSFGLKFTPSYPEPTHPKSLEILPPSTVSKRDEGLKNELKLYGDLISSETIYFPNGSSDLNSFSIDVVKRFSSQALKQQGEFTIVIEGFASKKGDSQSNMKLSQNRVKETKNYLMNQGIAAPVIKEVAYGDSAADSTVQDALNRKVMIRHYRK